MDSDKAKLITERNRIGTQGENLLATLMGHDNDKFVVTFLGEKFPIVDHIAFINRISDPFIFLIQVKSSSEVCTSTNFSSASINQDDYERLCALPYPTYVAGIDVNEWEAYIYPVFPTNERCSSIPKKYTLSKNTRGVIDRLVEDVMTFWNSTDLRLTKKYFTSNLI